MFGPIVRKGEAMPQPVCANRLLHFGRLAEGIGNGGAAMDIHVEAFDLRLFPELPRSPISLGKARDLLRVIVGIHADYFGSTGYLACTHSSHPPLRAYTLENPYSLSSCAARALVASLVQAQYRTSVFSLGYLAAQESTSAGSSLTAP